MAILGHKSKAFRDNTDNLTSEHRENGRNDTGLCEKGHGNALFGCVSEQVNNESHLPFQQLLKGP